MKRHKTKFEEIESQYIYYKHLKEINDTINDKNIDRRGNEAELNENYNKH